MREWSRDLFTEDDPPLVEQIRTRLLPRRGVRVGADEILVTVGAQQALYLIASLLVRGTTRVGIEDPGYADARNIFALKTEALRRAAGRSRGRRGRRRARRVRLRLCDAEPPVPDHGDDDARTPPGNCWPRPARTTSC